MDAAENNTTEVTPTDTKRSEQVPPKSSSRWTLVGAAVAVVVLGLILYAWWLDREHHTDPDAGPIGDEIFIGH